MQYALEKPMVTRLQKQFVDGDRFHGESLGSA